jgi:hypothetical protein
MLHLLVQGPFLFPGSSRGEEVNGVGDKEGQEIPLRLMYRHS